MANDLSARERFCIALSNTPLLAADCAIFLCGEDTEPRLKMLQQIMRSGGARHVIVTGGRHEPPRIHGAGELMGDILALGVAYNMLTIEPTAMNTHEQAKAVVQLLVANKFFRPEGATGGSDFYRIIVVAPSYHQFRAYLTFLQALQDAGISDAVHIVNAASGHVPWQGIPAGMEVSRLELLGEELAKIDDYQQRGHVASYDDGLHYLTEWQKK